MSQKPQPSTSIGNAVKKAIRHLGESKGSSFADVKKYLFFAYLTSGQHIPDSASIKQYLKNAVDNGTILKLDNGYYKIKQIERCRTSNRSRSRNNKCNSRSRSKKRSGIKRRSLCGSKELGRLSSAKQATVTRRGKSSRSRSRNNKSSGRSRSKRRSCEKRRFLSGSKKPGRPSNAKQATGSEKINLRKTKRKRSSCRTPLEKKQAPQTRSVTSKKVYQRKKEASSVISISAYRDESDFVNPDIKKCTYFI